MVSPKLKPVTLLGMTGVTQRAWVHVLDAGNAGLAVQYAKNPAWSRDLAVKNTGALEMYQLVMT